MHLNYFKTYKIVYKVGTIDLIQINEKSSCN